MSKRICLIAILVVSILFASFTVPVQASEKDIIDLTTINNIELADALASDNTSYISDYSMVSGNTEEFSGRISTYKNILYIDDADSFEVGQGIIIENADSNSLFDGWLITEITNIRGKKIYLKDSATNRVHEAKVFHDDTVAINAVIAEANDNLVFDITSSYALGVELQGDKNYFGNSFEFKNPVYAGGLEQIKPIVTLDGVENILFTGFNFDNGSLRGVRNTSMIGVTSIFLINTNNIEISDCNVYDNDYVGIQMFGENSNVVVDNNNFYNIDVAVEVMPEYLGSMEVDSITITNNYIDGGTSEGISIESGLYDYKRSSASNITIAGNTILNKPSTAILYGSRTTNSVIENNTIYNCLNGIATRDIHLEPEEALISENVLITKNTIESCTWMGISLEGSNVTATENYFKEITEAIMVYNGPYLNNSEISNNNFENCGLNSGYVMMLGNVADTEVENNIFHQTATGANGYTAGILLANEEYTGLSIRGNKLLDGISIIMTPTVSKMTECEIVDNVFSYLAYPGKTKRNFKSLGLTYYGNYIEDSRNMFNIMK